MRSYWICALILAFGLGMGTERVLKLGFPLSVAAPNQNAALAGIEKLHRLDERITLLNDPKALQQEWTDDAVRLEPDGPVDVGKTAIYATDVHSSAESPGAAIVSYRPDIRDVRVFNDWAFEWGLFDAGFREAANGPVEQVSGKLLRVLHREREGEWKFSRVMVVWSTKSER
jgi:ketosteroid isomerase-like protein